MMNAAAPALDTYPEPINFGIGPVIIFLVLGLLFVLFPRKVAAFQIWMLERELRGARKPWRVILYRVMGVGLLFGSAVFLVFFLKYTPVPRS